MSANTIQKTPHIGQRAVRAGFGFDKANKPVPVADPPLTVRRSCLNYDNNQPVQKQIKALKYDGKRDQAAALGERLVTEYQRARWQPAPTLIVAVPLAPARLRERGFNQSALLASVLSDGVGVPMIQETVRRVRYERPQVGLRALQRQENVAGAFVAEPELARDQVIVLVDDVVTTGATLRACAEALIKAGAAVVYGLTVGAVPFEREKPVVSGRHASIRIVTSKKPNRDYRYAQLVKADGKTKLVGPLDVLTGAPLLARVVETASDGAWDVDELRALLEAPKGWRDLPLNWRDVS